MLSILRRNAEWISSHRESLGKKPRLREEFSERAEIKVLDALRVLGGEEWDVYHRVRVPMLDTIRGKGEIDLIAVGSKCVLAVEVKNWVGSVEEADGEFLQRGESRGRVLETHNDKVKSLERMYRSETNCNVPPIFSLVIFPNPRTLLSDGVSRMVSCWLLDDLESFYQSTIAAQNEMPIETRSEFSRMFEEFGTWDNIEFHGGLLLSGDVADGFSICSGEGSEIDRLSISKVSFRPTRGEWATRILGPRVEAKVEFRDGKIKFCSVDPFREFAFLPAGSPRVSSDPSRIHEISFGHMGLEGWREFRNRDTPSKRKEAQRRYSSGDLVVGTVEGWVESGILVELDKSGCIGLLHNRAFSTMSEMQISRAFYSKGKEIEVEVSTTYKNGKIVLNFPA